MSAKISLSIASAPSQGDLRAGIWRLADPKITLASVASMILGASVAAHDGPLSLGWLALTVLGIFFVEVAKNASGEVFDFDSGTDLAVRPADRSPFSGGKRVMVDGLLSRSQTWIIALVGYALGGAAGIAILLFREPSVFWLGVIGMALAFFYHAPPLRLSYRGLGELAVATAYGPVIACGTYLVQRGEVRPDMIASSIPLGILIAAFLWINELPDCDADRSAGKRTLVVRLGKRRAAIGLSALIALAFALEIALVLFAAIPATTLLALIAAPIGARASLEAIRAEGDTQRLIPAQKGVLLTFLATAVFSGIGWLIAGLF